MKTILNLKHSETGASMIEYALLVALISVISIPAISFAGNHIEETFVGVSTHLEEDLARVPGHSGYQNLTGDVEGDDTQDDASHDTSTQGGTTQGGTPQDSTQGDTPQDGTQGDTPQGTESTESDSDDAATETEGESAEDPTPTHNVSGPHQFDPADPMFAFSLGEIETKLENWNGSNGQWTFRISHSHTWPRNKQVTYQITKFDFNGNATTSTLTLHINSNSSYAEKQWNNQLSRSAGNMSGVAAVEIKVVKVRAQDNAWQWQTLDVTDSPTFRVEAPAIP